MATRLTVIVRHHPNGGIPVIGPKSKEEYYDLYTKARKDEASTFGITDKDGDLAVFVLDEIQGIYFETV